MTDFATHFKRVQRNIAESYVQAQIKSAVMPQTLNSDNLPATIASIPTAGIIAPHPTSSDGWAHDSHEKVVQWAAWIEQNPHFAYSPNNPYLVDFFAGTQRMEYIEGEYRPVVILGFCHDYRVDTRMPCGITARLQFALDEEMPMNQSTANAPSWVESWLRTERLPRIKDGMNADLRNIITPVLKLTHHRANIGTWQHTADDLWIESQSEVEARAGISANGMLYPFYGYVSTGTGGRTARLPDGTAVRAWLRNPPQSGDHSYAAINTSGSTGTATSNHMSRIMLAYCIGGQAGGSFNVM